MKNLMKLASCRNSAKFVWQEKPNPNDFDELQESGNQFSDDKEGKVNDQIAADLEIEIEEKRAEAIEIANKIKSKGFKGSEKMYASTEEFINNLSDEEVFDFLLHVAESWKWQKHHFDEKVNVEYSSEGDKLTKKFKEFVENIEEESVADKVYMMCFRSVVGKIIKKRESK